MGIENSESINKDKLEQLLTLKWIQDTKLSKDRIEMIAENFSVQDLLPIMSELRKGNNINVVNWDTTQLKLNIFEIIVQCQENEKKKLEQENQEKLETAEAKLKSLKQEQTADKRKNEQKVDTLKQLLFWDDEESKNQVDKNDELKATLQVIALNSKNDQTLKEIKDSLHYFFKDSLKGNYLSIPVSGDLEQMGVEWKHNICYD